jgi:hypothetical protein
METSLPSAQLVRVAVCNPARAAAGGDRNRNVAAPALATPPAAIVRNFRRDNVIDRPRTSLASIAPAMPQRFCDVSKTRTIWHVNVFVGAFPKRSRSVAIQSQFG